MEAPTEDRPRYVRSPLLITDHPGRPLDGKVISMQANDKFDGELDEGVLRTVVDETKRRYDVEKFAEGLRVGFIYYDRQEDSTAGVSWPNTPESYDRMDSSEYVDELPEDVTLVADM